MTLDHNQDDRLWAKLDSQFFGFDKSVFLCLTYVTPDKSCPQSSRDNIWNQICHEIADFTAFNARTGTISDYIMFDSGDHVPVHPDYIPWIRSYNDSLRTAYIITMEESSWTYVKLAISD